MVWFRCINRRVGNYNIKRLEIFMIQFIIGAIVGAIVGAILYAIIEVIFEDKKWLTRRKWEYQENDNLLQLKKDKFVAELIEKNIKEELKKKIERMKKPCGSISSVPEKVIKYYNFIPQFNYNCAIDDIIKLLK